MFKKYINQNPPDTILDETLMLSSAPIVQGIERRFPKPLIQVRVLVGAPFGDHSRTRSQASEQSSPAYPALAESPGGGTSTLDYQL